MGNAVEEEELRDDEGLDEHDGACSDDQDEGYDVPYADCVEDNVARPCQGAFEKRHSLIRANVSKLDSFGTSGG